MSHIPKELYYTPTHEWLRLEDNIATIGITDHAQSLLGDLVYVDLPGLQRDCAAEEALVVLESVKTAADAYAPLQGTVVAVNEMLRSAPETINKDPYGEGWLIRIQVADPKAVDALLSEAAYRRRITEGE